MISFVLEQTKVMSPDPASCESRHDDSNVPGTGNHRVRSISFALERVTAVRMEISNDGHATSPTNVPQFRERITLQNAHTAGVSIAVKLVVVNEVLRATLITIDSAKHEAAAFMQSMTSLS